MGQSLQKAKERKMKTPSSHALLIILGAALLSAGLPAPAARAGLDVDFGASVQLGDDSSIYIAVSSRYFDRDATEVGRWHRHCDNPDDLAVALFIAANGEGSPDDVFAMRAKGLSWWEIGVRFGVPADLWFPPVRRDPGPPYGKAYGHWKKHGRAKNSELTLSDSDARNLVAVRVLHSYYGVSVEAAMEWRASGGNLAKLTASEYRSRHDKTKGKTASAGMGNGNGGVKQRGKGKGTK
jgi:hypothetical protein